jgi:NAD(P)-dependent dehydrogenase (short-subunit alcohol dehydrogenase family)
MPDWPELNALGTEHPDMLHVVPLDVGSLASVQSAAQSVAATVDRVDLLINNAGVGSPTSRRSIREPQSYDEMHRLYDVNALGPLRVVEAFLPLTDHGSMRRLCFVSSEAGSIERALRTAWYGYCMSKAALNMAVKIAFNHLRPEGYTFRLYHPGWMRTYMGGKKNPRADMEPEEAAAKALPFCLGDCQDEDRLALIDHAGAVWPW